MYSIQLRTAIKMSQLSIRSHRDTISTNSPHGITGLVLTKNNRVIKFQKNNVTVFFIFIFL